MILERNTLLYAFTADKIPSYPCPSCKEGRLRLDGKISSEQTASSELHQRASQASPDSIGLRFNCKLKCYACSETVSIIGSGGVEIEHDIDSRGEWSSEWVEYYIPKYFFPSLKIAICPDGTPPAVKEQLYAASALYFAQPDSCCNSIRAAAEEILTDLGVQVLNDKGGFISFSERINRLPAEKESVKAIFDAIRWLGNHGSHPGSGLQKSHALDAFELIELLLEELYSDKKLKIQELAKRINAAKGPVGRHGWVGDS